MTNFNWQMEDEAEWADETGERKAKKKRPSFTVPIMILVAVGIAIGGIYSLVNRQLEGAGREIKADVRRTHELVLAAADSGDVELFTTFLSGINANWLEQQRESVKRERFDAPNLLGIELLERPLQIDDVTLASTLDEATITYTRWYSTADQANGVVGLHQIAIYRRGEDRWLLAPPTAEFWGEESSLRKGQMTLIYPRRDETRVVQLAEDLAALLPEICNQLPNQKCPEGWQLTLKLSTDPETMLYVNQIEGEIDDLSIHLPTPSLLGLPFDAAGYEALSQSYQRLLERRLSAVFTLYLAENPSLVAPIYLVRSPSGEFVESEPSDVMPNADMTFSCSTGTTGMQDWSVFRYSLQTGEWDQIFQREYEGGDSGFVIPLEGRPDSYVIQEYLRGDLLTARLLLWENGQTMVIGEQMVNFDSALVAPFFLRETDPTGRYLLIGKSVDVNNSWYLLDREMCQRGEGCIMQPIISAPLWSPEGSRMVMQEPLIGNSQTNRYRTLYLANGLGQNPVEIGEGAAPFWLNEDTFGYSRLNGQGEVELVLVEGDDIRVVLETAELQALVPETESRQWNKQTIQSTWANPENSLLVLMTTPSARENSGPYDFYLVQGDPNNGDQRMVKWLFSSDFPVTNSFFPGSPDGRYLMMTLRGTPAYFYDLETEMPMPFDMSLGWVVDWSPDGRFYVQWSDDALTLTEPATGYQAQLLYDLSTCIGLEWLYLKK